LQIGSAKKADAKQNHSPGSGTRRISELHLIRIAPTVTSCGRKNNSPEFFDLSMCKRRALLLPMHRISHLSSQTLTKRTAVAAISRNLQEIAVSIATTTTFASVFSTWQTRKRRVLPQSCLNLSISLVLPAYFTDTSKPEGVLCAPTIQRSVSLPLREIMIRARKHFLILFLGLAIVSLPLSTIQAQTGDSQSNQATAPNFWNAAIEMVEKRQQANQPIFQAKLTDLEINSVCKAAHQEMERRGIAAGPSPSAEATPAYHFNFSDSPAAQNTSPPVETNTIPFQEGPNTAQELRIGDQTVEIADSARFAIDRIHANCFDATEFPSAAKCQSCHPGHYEEWSVSPHAYAQFSPVFNAMSSKLNVLTNGTLGDFCIRCHTPVGMARNEPIVMSNLDRVPAAREGVTCVVCHRTNQNWGKISGRQALVGGGLDKPVYGPVGNDVLEQVLANPDEYGVLTTGKIPGVKSRNIHKESVPFFALTTSATCASCHDVFAPNGFRLEDVFSEFKQSPAAKQKQQNCQDCHMGLSPGVASGYAFEPVAKVGNAFTSPRKRTNHMMIGPDYSIIHPGLFPHNPKAVKEENSHADELQLGLATLREWLTFDYRAGWGMRQFEENADKNYPFPDAWKEQTRRIRARDILDDQFRLLNKASVARHQLLSVGYRLGDVVFDGVDRKGLHFKIKVSNGTDGHGVPSGFDAERLVFLKTTVVDRNGKLVFVSGDLDPNGDVRDSHSFYVHNGKLPLDRQLFSLQSRFLTRNVRGGEREQVLNVAFSIDPLPYFRPATRPYTVLGRPLGARKHKQNLEVGGHRWAEYSIQPSQLTGCGPYTVSVQLVAAMVPINLIQEISSVGFDYGMSARQIADAIVDGHVVVHTRNALLHVDE
jgi:hypothetical protein